MELELASLIPIRVFTASSNSILACLEAHGWVDLLTRHLGICRTIASRETRP